MLLIRLWLQRRRLPRAAPPLPAVEPAPAAPAHESERVRADIQLLRAEFALLMARRHGEEQHP